MQFFLIDRVYYKEKKSECWYLDFFIFLGLNNILSFFCEKFCFSDKNRTFASRLLSKFEKILVDSFRFSVRRGVSYVHFK